MHMLLILMACRARGTDDTEKFNFYSWDGREMSSVQSKESITRHFCSAIVHFFPFCHFMAHRKKLFSFCRFKSVFFRWQQSYFAYKSRTWGWREKWKMCQHKNFFFPLFNSKRRNLFFFLYVIGEKTKIS